MARIPDDLLYSEEHEYVRRSDAENVVVVGITDYAQGELGDVVYVDLPKVGTAYGRMDVFGTIEAVKAVSELFAPISGAVIEVNTALDKDPALVNRDPYGEGWMIKLRIKNTGEFDQLLGSEEYKKHIGEQRHPPTMKTTREIARAFLVTDRFVTRHIGPSPDETEAMLATLGYSSLDEFIDEVVPADIRLSRPLNLPPGRSEREVLQALRGFAAQNQLFRSYIGMGYYPCFTPQVIQRNIVENPGWYTAYTPYQPEIAQGRLEALLNYQTVVSDLTGLPIANASLLDEATAAAEAVHLTQSVTTAPAGATPVYLVADNCHPQTIAVLQTRAVARGLKLVVADPARFSFTPGVIGALVQYPTTEGAIEDYARVCAAAHAVGALVTAATDLLALTLLQPPGEWGADIAVVHRGPGGRRRIAQRVHPPPVLPAPPPTRRGSRIVPQSYSAPLCVEAEPWARARLTAPPRARRTNLRTVSPTRIGIALDET